MTTNEFLTTRELADLLRIGERKVYDLAAKGEVPHVKVVGKLLFPRDRVMGWIASGAVGPGAETPLPPVLVGSSDPLLDWALRQSDAGLAA
jgi:excisionase family DNA binding protein